MENDSSVEEFQELMNPEKEQALNEHISAIAKILYEDTPTSELTSLESIEKTVRDKMLTHVSPQMGVFLLKQRLKHLQEKPEQ